MDSQQNLNNNADHQFGNGKYMTHAQKIEFLKTQQQMSNETKQTKTLDPSVIDKGNHLLKQFDMSIKYTVTHLITTLELMYRSKIEHDTVTFYLDVLYYVTKVYKPVNENNPWQICPICSEVGHHADHCSIKQST